MPILEQGGAMSIVAHADDDLLFMNPDIANSIADGETNVTVFITAGDAGYEDWYWQGREVGAKAAYALMADADDWVDETVSLTNDTTTYDVQSSYLASAPEVRLYFLRLPDGAGAIADPADYESLARLEDGTRDDVETVDGAATYTRSDLVGVLTGLMDAHDPSEFRLQVAEGDFAAGEHTDHIHTTEFALEALEAHDGTDFQVSHYVNYQSDQLDQNLSDQDAAFSLEVMNAYAEHDPGATDENGNLLPIYVEWSARQYVAETYSSEQMSDETNNPVDDPVVVPPSQPDDPDQEDGMATYSLGDNPDSFLFDVNAQTGDITPKAWFTPSLDDAWDFDEDYIYEVELISTPVDGGAATSQTIQFDTVSENVLVQVGAQENPPPEDDEDIVDDSPAPSEQDEPVTPPPDETPTVHAGATYSLTGADEFLFEIDSTSGVISTKDWFIPSYDDAWDQNEDHIYELTRTATDDDGAMVSREFLNYEVSPDDAFTLISSTPDLLLALSFDATETTEDTGQVDDETEEPELVDA